MISLIFMIRISGEYVSLNQRFYNMPIYFKITVHLVAVKCLRNAWVKCYNVYFVG